MIAIRVDFSSDIGFGHLKRQEAFIKWKMKNENLKKEDFVILCKECDEKHTDIPVIKIKNEEDFFEKIKKIKPNEVVVDNYNFTYEDEKKFKTLFKEIKLVCFDDLYQNHCCDVIVNINPYAKVYKYKNLPSHTKVLIKRPILREEFYKQKRKKHKKKGIFISFGGTDAKGIGLKVLQTLKPLKKEVHFYTTSANKNLEKLKKFCFLHKWCHLHINEDVAKGMAKAEFGIITPSQIMWEALFMKMPFLAIKVADNQKYNTRYLKSKNIKVLSEREIYKVPRFIP